MNIEDIKEGETYNVRMKFTYIDEDGNYCFNMETKSYIYRLFNKKDVETCVSPIISSDKNTETAPKYDPNRPFRKGDKVKAVLRHGRIPNDGVPKDAILEVIADERDGIVKVLHKMGVILEIFNVYALYLELVTPVEELEPYYIEKHGEKPGGLCYTVHKHGGYAESSFYYGTCRTRDEAQAKAAAEAERDRLNAEYRKEQSNGLGH